VALRRTVAGIILEYRPAHSNKLTSGKIADCAIYLDYSGPAREILSSLISILTNSVNNVGYKGLFAKPSTISIEPKTES